MLTFTVSPGLALGMWYCDTNSPSPVINDSLHRLPKGLKPVFFTFHDMVADALMPISPGCSVLTTSASHPLRLALSLPLFPTGPPPPNAPLCPLLPELAVL